MTNGWFIAFRSKEFLELLREDPKGFCLLSLIAHRARWAEDQCSVTGLGYGQAFIGDFKEAGIETRQAFRLACKRLFKRGFLTIQGTNKGTIATLLPQAIYGINPPAKEPAEEPSRNQRGTNEEPLNKKVIKKEEKNKTPLPPEGDGLAIGGIRPAWRRMSKGDQKLQKIESNTELMARIGGWFGRQPNTPWTVAEAIALERINPSDSAVDGMESYYLATSIPAEKDIRRRSLPTLLNNWPEELDRARAHFKATHS
jgi:hypothetical protein